MKHFGQRRGSASAAPAMGMQAALGRLARYCRPYWGVTALAILFDMAGVICRLAGPNILSEITNSISGSLAGEIDLPGITRLCVLLLALYAAGSLLGYLTSLIMTLVTQRVNRRLRGDISRKINRLPVAYFHQTTVGDVLSRVTNDVDTIGQTMQNSIASLISAATMFVGALVMMFYTNAIMAATGVAASVAGFALMLVIMGRSQRYFSARQKWLGRMNGHIEEIYSGHSVVRLFGSEAKERAVFADINAQLAQSDWKGQFFSGLMQPLMGFVGNFGYVAVCVVGALLTLQGHIGFGVIVAFMVYIRQFTNPLSQLAQAATQLQSTAAAAGRVFEFLEAAEMQDESHKPRQLAANTVRGEVEFDHVRFGYTPQKTIIHDFCLHVKPGQKVAIVGPTGAGKSTLVNLLMRFYEVNAGEIRIDGVPTRQMAREEVHSLFGMVLQDTWTFEGTLRENLAYGKQNVTDAQLDAVCEAAGLTHFVHALPQGYDTQLNEQLAMSAGQKQLLTIARAMLADPPMMILDEATSSVDTRTEARIQQAMDALTKGRTSFVIAHRLSTIRNADVILVLRDGDVAESGTHEQLLAKQGFYATLYNSQFEQAS